MAYGCPDVALILRQPILKSHRVYERKKVFETDVRSQKQNERQHQIMKLLASGKVHFVYVTSLLFDVIGRLYPLGTRVV